MFRLDVTDVPITAARSTALDAPSNVQSLIGTLVEWKRSHSLACVGASSPHAAPLCLAASSPSALHNLAFQKVSVAGPLLRKELMNHAPPICMLISSRLFYCVLVITSWVINIHLVLRDISNISFPRTPRHESVFSCRQVTFSDVFAAADSLRLLYTSENTYFLAIPRNYRLKQWCFSIKNINANMNVRLF